MTESDKAVVHLALDAQPVITDDQGRPMTYWGGKATQSHLSQPTEPIVWWQYIAGMIEAYLQMSPKLESRKSAIASIIERRLMHLLQPVQPAAVAQAEPLSDEPTCILCHGKEWHYPFHAYPPGMAAPETKVKCTQCAIKPPIGAQE